MTRHPPQLAVEVLNRKVTSLPPARSFTLQRFPAKNIHLAQIHQPGHRRILDDADDELQTAARACGESTRRPA